MVRINFFFLFFSDNTNRPANFQGNFFVRLTDIQIQQLNDNDGVKRYRQNLSLVEETVFVGGGGVVDDVLAGNSPREPWHVKPHRPTNILGLFPHTRREVFYIFYILDITVTVIFSVSFKICHSFWVVLIKKRRSFKAFVCFDHWSYYTETWINHGCLPSLGALYKADYCSPSLRERHRNPTAVCDHRERSTQTRPLVTIT